jgi:predicted HAD superfamily phosphohydrolase YqeG
MTCVIPVPTLADALELAGRHRGTAVIDLDGTLAPTGSLVNDSDEYPEEVWALNAAQVPVVVLTNRRESPTQIAGHPVMNRAGKPWTSLQRLAPYQPISMVIGDQFGTDGLLAARLNVPYVQLMGMDPARPLRTKVSEALLRYAFLQQPSKITKQPPKLALPGPEPDLPTHEKWILHVTGLYQLEYQLLSIAVAAATLGVPIIGSLLFSLPPSTPPALLLAAPLGPTLFMMLLAYFFFNSRIVGVYARSVERLITGPQGTRVSDLRIPALARLTSALYGGERKGLLVLRIFFMVFATLIIGICLSVSAIVLWRVDDETMRNWATGGYLLLWTLIVTAYAVSVSHRTDDLLISSAVLRDQRKTRHPSPPRSWPNFLGFVLVPRFASLTKGLDGVLIIAIGWLLAPLVVPINGHQSLSVVRASIGVLVFEGVLYQTRYLLNGLREDASSNLQLPSDRRNNDLQKPFSPEQLMAGPFFALGRLALFAVIATRCKLVDFTTSLVFVGMFLIAFYAYEIPREAARGRLREILRANRRTHASNQVGLVPAPVNAQLLDALAVGVRQSRWSFLAAGLGYVVRVGFVLYVLDPALALSWVGVSLMLAFWAGRCASVAAGWAIEFTGALSTNDHSVLHRNVIAKPHLVWAARYVPGLVPTKPVLANFNECDAAESRKDLFKSAPYALRAPWRLMWAYSIVVLALLALDVSSPLWRSGILLVGLICVGITGVWTSLMRKGGQFGNAWLVGLFAALVTVPLVLNTHLTASSGARLIAVVGVCAFWMSNSLAASEGGQLSKLIDQANNLIAGLVKVLRSLGGGLRTVSVMLLGASVVESLDKRLGDDADG